MITNLMTTQTTETINSIEVANMILGEHWQKEGKILVKAKCIWRKN